MMIRVERFALDNADEYRWFVHNCRTALVQQTLEWGRIVAELGEDQPIFFIARDDRGHPVGALPAYVYRCKPVSLLVSVPQAGGYGGVMVGNDNLKEEIYAALLEAMIDEARQQGCGLTTISTQPFFGDIDLYRRYLVPDFERENFFQFIDLETDFLAATSSQQRKNIRKSLRKAEEYGLRVVFDDTDDFFRQWYAVHEKRMTELRTAPLPRMLFEGARKYLLNDGMGFFAYVLDGDRVIGGSLFVGLNDVLDVFLMSSDSEMMDKQPGKILVSAALDRSRDMGFKYFNWQSCNSRESGVYAFKQRWGSKEGTHYYLTKVTGDISTLRQLPLEEVKKRYRWHYVMPYEQFLTEQLEEA